MRVLVLCFEDVYHPTGGMGVHVRDLYRAMAAMGHEIVIISIASEPPAYGRFTLCPGVEVLKIEQRLTYQSPIAILQHFLFEQNFLLNVLEHYGREKFDLIHIHDSHMWSCAEALRLLWKIPVVLTCHLSPLMHEIRYQADTLAEYKNQIEGTALCNADARISVSQYYHDELKRSILGADSTVIHNGVDAADLASYSRSDAVRARYGAGPRHQLVVMVGRPVDNKGVEAFLEASNRFPSESHRFVFVGYLADGVEKHYPLAAKIMTHAKVRDNFVWERHLSHADKFQLMASADIGVMPSRFEPFGICALEWMALGVPLVVTQVGGLREFCTPGNSTPIQPTADSLIDALTRHVRDERKLLAARTTAESFTWECAARKTVEVYQHVVSHPA
jgi:1,4-alpha-glucan branching enzyme